MRPGAGDYGQPRLLIPAPEDPRHAHLGWPKITRTDGGALVAAFLAGREHTVGGCPAVAVSHDGGATFSDPRILRRFGPRQDYAHSGNLALGLAEDDAPVLLAMAFTGDERHSIFGWRSEDGGARWERVDTSALAESATGSVYGSIFPVPGRGLAAFGHYRPPRGDGLWLALSRDRGRSWGRPRTISERRLFEPAFTCVDGRLIGLVRENSACAYRQFVSDDAGASWHEPRSIMRGPDATHPSPFITRDRARRERVLALQSQRTARGEVYLWEADAETLAWRRLGLVATFEGFEDYSYPWMAHLGGGEWFVVFYAGQTRGPNSIFGMRLRVD